MDCKNKKKPRLITSGVTYINIKMLQWMKKIGFNNIWMFGPNNKCFGYLWLRQLLQLIPSTSRILGLGKYLSCNQEHFTIGMRPDQSQSFNFEDFTQLIGLKFSNEFGSHPITHDP